MKIKSTLFTLLKFALAILVLLILWKSDLLELQTLTVAFNKGRFFLMVALGTYLLLSTIGATRWWILLKQVGVNLTWTRTVALHYIGMFFSTLLPGGTGGDLVKGFYLYRDEEGERKLKSVAAIIVDRVIGLYGLLCVGLFMALLNIQLIMNNPMLKIVSMLYGGIFLAASVGIGILLSPFHQRVQSSLLKYPIPGKSIFTKLSDAIYVYAGNGGKKILLLCLMLTWFIHFGLVLVYFLADRSLGLGLNLSAHGFAVPLMTMVNGLPIAPAGIGVGEAAGKVFYGAMGLKKGGGELLAIFHFCVVIGSLSGLPVYLLYKKKLQN